MSIEESRKEIDRVDAQIINLIAGRIKLAEKIGKEKLQRGKRITDKDREIQVLENIKNLARREGISPEDMETIYRLIIAAAKGNEGHTVDAKNENAVRKLPEGRHTKVAIIGGSGRMGQWFANFLLKEGMEVIITGRNRQKLAAAGERLGVKTATNAIAVKKSDVVVISVPIGSFKKVVEGISSFTHPGQVIVDITSVKTMPVSAMHKYLKEAKLLGIHPLFGPGAKSVANMNFALTPTSKKESALAQKVTDFLEARGARVTLMTPQEHDGMMAVILGLAHYIALVAADTLSSMKGLKEMAAISGITYKVLLTLIESVVSEDPELYSALQMGLTGLPELQKLFQYNAELWADLVKNKDGKQFTTRMKTIKKKLEKESVDFGKAYANMYKLAEGLR